MTKEHIEYLLPITKAAYDSYGRTVDYKNYQGLPMPKFEELGEKIQEAWINAVDTAIEMATFKVDI